MVYITTRFTTGSLSNLRAGYYLGVNNGLFEITLYTSIISAGLGMAKTLKVGPCRILPDKGLLGGLLTLRFVLIFLACSSTLFGKASFFVQSLRCSTSDDP